MATDQLINKAQGDAIISGLTAIKNAINDQPVPTQVEDVVADAFDEGVSYVPGDYCIHENKLYICDVAHHGAWDGNDFTLTTVGAVLESLNNDLSDKLGEFTFLQVAGSTSPVTITIPQGTKEIFVEAASSGNSSYMVCHGSIPVEVAKKYASGSKIWTFLNYDGATRYLVNVNVENIANNQIIVSWSNCTTPAIFYR